MSAEVAQESTVAVAAAEVNVVDQQEESTSSAVVVSSDQDQKEPTGLAVDTTSNSTTKTSLPPPLTATSTTSSSAKSPTIHDNVKVSESHFNGETLPRKRPTWSPTYQLIASSLQKSLYTFKNDVKNGRIFIRGTHMPKPVLQVAMKKVYIARREDALPFGMDVKDAEGLLKAEWIEPTLKARATEDDAKAGTERVIIYSHGGAYFFGSRKSHRQVTWRLAKYANARVLSIDYRLAPEHAFPLPLNDMASAYLSLIDPPKGQPKYRPDQIVFMGDSAGGNLCLTTLLYLRDAGFPMPAGLGLLCPWMDMTHSSPSFVFNGVHDILPAVSKDSNHLKDDQAHYYVKDNVHLDNPLVSPLFAKEDSERPTPPILMQVGDVERLRDENLMFYAETFKNSKVRLEVFEDMVHVWHLFAVTEPVSREALKRLCQFTKDVTNVDPAKADSFEPKFERACVRVHHKKGYPEDPFEDIDGFLAKERERLDLVRKEVLAGN